MLTVSGDCAGSPMYMQLYTQLKEEILSHQRPPRSKLPSRRTLAAQLGVSLSTVNGAYEQLLAEGYIAARPRSGYYVCAIDTLQVAEKPPALCPEPEPEQKPCAIDFHPGRIDEEKFPFSVWQRLVRAAASDPMLLRRTPPQGDYGLRQAVADYLFSARGVRCAPEQMVIGAGADALLGMLSYLLDNDYALGVENPVYNKAYRLFARTGHPVVPVQTDKSGIPVEQLPPAGKIVLYTTPSHQYPLGYRMPMSRRVELLNWSCAARDRYIIEDDYDSEFRYSGKPLPSLQSADKNSRVIYMGTFSRVLAPSVRIAYMVLPQPLLERYRRTYDCFSTGVSTLEQLTLRSFLQQGFFTRHVNRMRVVYGQKHKTLTEALSACGQLTPIGEPAGTQVTVRVRNGMDEAELVRRAAEAGVAVYPISPYFIGPMDGRFRGKILLGFGALSDGQITRGVGLLRQAWGL